MRIAVMGAGGVGGYLGAKLARGGHDVALIARGAHLEALRRHGLRIPVLLHHQREICAGRFDPGAAEALLGAS